MNSNLAGKRNKQKLKHKLNSIGLPLWTLGVQEMVDDARAGRPSKLTVNKQIKQ